MRADEAFGDRVGPWCLHRCLDDADVGGGEDGVERGGELGVAVADEEPEATAGVVEVHEQVAGLLGQPGAGRVRGDAEDVYAAGGVLDDEERVEPVQGDGVEVEQVAGEDRVGLRPQELGPGRSGPPWRRVDPGVMQDGPDGGGADLVAEAGEFAVDASISPAGVLGGQAEDQGTEARGDGAVGRVGSAGWSSGGRSAGGASAGWWPG